MARSEARIAVSIWNDPDFLALSVGAQRMFMFLISQPDLAHDGVIALRPRRWAKSAAKMTVAQVLADIDELTGTRFTVVDEDTEELLVRSFIRRDKVYMQPNVLRSAASHVETVSSKAVREAIRWELERIADDIPKGSEQVFAAMLGTLRRDLGDAPPPPSNIPTAKGFENPSANPSDNPSRNPSGVCNGERGVVTAVHSDSPSPLPRAPQPAPNPSPPLSANQPPPEQCDDHSGNPNPPPCGRCADARRNRRQWETTRAANASAAQSAKARDHAIAARAAIDACHHCDHHGKRDGRTCLHDPNLADRAQRGAAAARAAIRTPAPSTEEP